MVIASAFEGMIAGISSQFVLVRVMTQTQDNSAPVMVLSFDGKSDRVELGKQPQFKLEQALTLEAWIYPKAHQSK